MKILHLTLKKKWFDMILSGEKKEEYREFKEYWKKRLDWYNPNGYFINKIKFINGYGNNRPWFIVELERIQTGTGFIKWGAPAGECFILKLGKILDKGNIK